MPEALFHLLDRAHPHADALELVYGGLDATEEGLRAAADTSLRRYFSGAPLKDLRVRFRGTAENGRAVRLFAGGYEWQLDEQDDPAARLRLDTVPVASTGRTALAAGPSHEIVYERAQGRLRILLDGKEVLAADDPRPALGIFDLELLFPAGTLAQEVRIEGSYSAERVASPPRAERLDLSVCVDFSDDLCYRPWTERTFREAMRLYRAHGVTRLYFICLPYDEGYWDQEARACWQAPPTEGAPERKGRGLAENVRRTYEAVGDFLPAAVRAAHEAGLPLFAVMKPYESTHHQSFPEGSEEARRFGKVPRLGGSMWWSSRFTARHPHLRIERNMGDVPGDIGSRRVRTIRLTAEAGLAGRLDPSRIRLWTSADNGRYLPYEGPLRIREDSGEGQTILLDGLELPSRFFAITVEGATRSFGNILPRLVAVRDAEGRALPITFGQTVERRGSDFRRCGFAFDMTPIPSSIQHRDEYCWLDGGRALGIALGRERYLPGALCEAYPEVQEEWMRQVEYYLAAGVDGIDFRDLHHNRAYDWTSFGFNAPLVEAFRERHGVDILREPFDYALLRRLRGELYTAFLRRARNRLREAGKAMHLHVSARMKSPEWHTEMEVHFDWPAWIREGLADEITLKIGTARGSISPLVIAAAREAGLKVNACPYINGLPKRPEGRSIMAHMLRDALEGGVDGMVLYENAAFMAAQEDESVALTHPWLIEMPAQVARSPRRTD